MADQASNLRRVIGTAHPSKEEQMPLKPIHTIAVTSGKGGVGKTSLASNLGLALINQGKRVAILDGDLGLANIDVLFQLSPRYNVKHVIEGTKTLREIILEGPMGLSIVPASSGIEALADLSEAERARVVFQLSSISELADILLIDTAAGISPMVLSFATASDQVIVLTTPDPTAMTDAYATIKVILQRKPAARIRLVVNMVRDAQHAREVASGIASVVQRFLRTEIRCIGYIPADPEVGKALRSQKPFLLTAPTSPAARNVNHLANKLLQMVETEESPVDFFRSILGQPASTEASLMR